MKCFQWRSLASDFLDKTLEEKLFKQASEHALECDRCSEAYAHYQIILGAITQQPRVGLPLQLRKTALSRKFSTQAFKLAQWKKIPWIFRTLLEAGAVVCLTLLLIVSGPWVYQLYQKKTPHGLQSFDSAEEPKLTASLVGQPIDTQEEIPQVAPHLHRGAPLSSQLWRFTLRSVSPDEIQTRIRALLKEFNSTHALNEGELKGREVPGGVEFDVLFPQEKILLLKQRLVELVSPHPERDFSWYRVKAKHPIPEGKVQAVIWVTQPLPSWE